MRALNNAEINIKTLLYSLYNIIFRVQNVYTKLLCKTIHIALINKNRGKIMYINSWKNCGI